MGVAEEGMEVQEEAPLCNGQHLAEEFKNVYHILVTIGTPLLLF